MKPADEIFEEAIDLNDAEQAAFLDQACADRPSLRAELEALLAAHAAADSFLEHSPVDRPMRPLTEKAGDVLGPYTLIRKIGDGGCGVVYLAWQAVPVRRQVALKVIKAGMDTQQVIARFEGERQALALMEHPDIARVFDAGATAAGRPYFAMEYVDGTPITRFCDTHQLPLGARLELFARCCLAIQHAHQKGIIHRDIKPSNILVTWRDAMPSPKVIDFGIAKATEERLTERTLVTRIDQFIGTPAYMSPEQADMREGDIDTRSDIYSLGVLLYELVAGGQPYDARTVARAGVDEVRRMIRETTPPRPTQRFTHLPGPERTEAARQRGATPGQLASALRGDLDWIVMRCLEKDRERRYSSAQELADDIRRHLRNEPVKARPPSRIYLTRKFIARHRLACASVAAIAATLILGTVVSVNQAIRATHAERLATAERDAAQSATAAEAIARSDAQRRQEQAEDLLTFMLGDFRTELEKIGRISLLDSVGEKVMAYFASLDPRDLTDNALAHQAQALTQIGEVRLREARYDDAEKAFTAAYSRAEALAERHPDNADRLFERAQAEFWIGFVARRRGHENEARTWLQRYRASTIALAALEGESRRARLELIYGHQNLAVLELERGNLEAAKAGFLAGRTVVEALRLTHPDDPHFLDLLGDIESWLGSIAEMTGRFDEAIALHLRSVDHWQQLSKAEPEVARWRFRITDGLEFANKAMALSGQAEAGLELRQRARSLLEGLVQQDPRNREWQRAAAMNLLSEVEYYIAIGSLEEARWPLAAALETLRDLSIAEPTSQRFQLSLATASRMEALRCLLTGDSGAEPAIREALSAGRTLVDEGGFDRRTVGELALACLLAGRIAEAGGDSVTARHHFKQALDTLGATFATSTDWLILESAAQALVLLDRPAEARPLIERLQNFGYQPADPLTAATLKRALPIVATSQTTLLPPE